MHHSLPRLATRSPSFSFSVYSSSASLHLSFPFLSFPHAFHSLGTCTSYPLLSFLHLPFLSFPHEFHSLCPCTSSLPLLQLPFLSSPSHTHFIPHCFLPPALPSLSLSVSSPRLTNEDLCRASASLLPLVSMKPSKHSVNDNTKKKKKLTCALKH